MLFGGHLLRISLLVLALSLPSLLWMVCAILTSTLGVSLLPFLSGFTFSLWISLIPFSDILWMTCIPFADSLPRPLWISNPPLACPLAGRLFLIFRKFAFARNGIRHSSPNNPRDERQQVLGRIHERQSVGVLVL